MSYSEKGTAIQSQSERFHQVIFSHIVYIAFIGKLWAPFLTRRNSLNMRKYQYMILSGSISSIVPEMAIT